MTFLLKKKPLNMTFKKITKFLIIIILQHKKLQKYNLKLKYWFIQNILIVIFFDTEVINSLLDSMADEQFVGGKAA